MKSLKVLAALAGAVLFTYWLFRDNSPAGSASAGTGAEVVYICGETKELIHAPLQTVPAVNPKTGRATLFRALYCADCRKWRPVPPPDVFPGNPLTYHCPKHRHPMQADGPMPKP